MISYEGDSSWIELVLKKLLDCVASDKPPKSNSHCAYCQFIGKRVASKSSSVFTPAPIKIDKKMPKAAISTVNKNAESDFAIELLEELPDRRLPIDELVTRIIKRNGKRATLPIKKRVLEAIYQLQQTKVLRLENGVAVLNNLMLS
jgi:hypothetical protein